MAIADSNFGRVAYIAETTFGTTPATPTLKTVRMTSSDFSYQSETTTSNELRTDRMVSDAPEVGASSGGSINFELSLGGSFDELVEAALCGTWTTQISNDSVAVIAGNKFSKTAGWSGVVAGQWLYASGFTDPANNGWHKVTAVTANDVTVASTLVVEAAAAGKKVGGKMLRNGTVKRSFSVEQAFLDINQFLLFRGQRLNSLSLSVSAGSIVTGAFAFQGTETARQGTTFSTGGTPTAASSTPVVNATSNVGKVQEGGANLTTAIQAIQLQLDNGLRNQTGVGSKFPVGIGLGRQTVSGSIDAYFEDGALFDKFLAHTASSLSFGFSDSAGNAYRVTIPKVFFTANAPAPGGIDQDVMQNLSWQAVLDAATNCQIQIDAVTAF